MFRFLIPLLFVPAISLFGVETNMVLGVETNMVQDSLHRLVQGNLRYMTSTTFCHNDWSAKRAKVLERQRPFAVIISCSDSRVPPELIFDQSLGDLFVVRVAGNVVDDFAIGSIEYGVSILGANLVVVLGHSMCGAVNAAVRGMKFNNHIQEVVDAIQPALEAAYGKAGDPLENAIKENIQIVQKHLIRSSPVLAQFVEKEQLSIMGAYYDLESGKVEFLAPFPEERMSSAKNFSASAGLWKTTN